LAGFTPTELAEQRGYELMKRLLQIEEVKAKRRPMAMGSSSTIVRIDPDQAIKVLPQTIFSLSC
jgi:hypothetical protein